LPQLRAINQFVQVLKGEDLAACGKKQALHVFASDPEAPTSYAGNYFVFWLATSLTLHT